MSANSHHNIAKQQHIPIRTLKKKKVMETPFRQGKTPCREGQTPHPFFPSLFFKNQSHQPLHLTVINRHPRASWPSPQNYSQGHQPWRSQINRIQLMHNLFRVQVEPPSIWGTYVHLDTVKKNPFSWNGGCTFSRFWQLGRILVYISRSIHWNNMSRVLGPFISIAAVQFQRCDDKIAEFPAWPWMYKTWSTTGYKCLKCQPKDFRHQRYAKTHLNQRQQRQHFRLYTGILSCQMRRSVLNTSNVSDATKPCKIQLSMSHTVGSWILLYTGDMWNLIQIQWS